MITCLRHYNILAKTRSILKMTTAITFSRQNDAGSRVSNTQYWENLVPLWSLWYILSLNYLTSLYDCKTTFFDLQVPPIYSYEFGLTILKKGHNDFNKLEERPFNMLELAIQTKLCVHILENFLLSLDGSLQIIVFNCCMLINHLKQTRRHGGDIGKSFIEWSLACNLYHMIGYFLI